MPRRAQLLASLPVVLLLVLAGVVTLRATASDAVSEAGWCERYAASHAAAAALPLTGQGRRVVVIGDSWSSGWRLDDPAAAWPAQLPGRVSVDGFPGSGFSETASPCGKVSFADRAATAGAGADALVVVEGGLNDFDQTYDAVRRGFVRLVGELQGADLVVVGPAPAPARLAGARRVDGWLRSLSEEYAVRYVSAISLDLPYLPDGLHPTRAGHREFGDFVAAALAG
ncbi:SGNH/GDSL hydrolase family protein [Nocardioides sp. KR10-350]|uniref:SGNH/GDSL hydrolase family protein n=1 Tax=Nocardioides cheoyonin TaxID=3156615 RepID=UPI0032B37AF9